jgi:hypothetical protein
MNTPLRLFCCLLLSLGLLLPSGWAKMPSWKTVKGETFRGEPVELLGPFVLFRTGGGNGRWLPATAFSPEDCRLIQAELAKQPPRATQLAAATGDATAELKGAVLRVKDKALVPADLTAQPEPELLLLLCGSHNDGEGWFMVSNLVPFYWRIQRTYPGLMEAVFLGVRHEADQQRNIAVASGMPWLVADFFRQNSLSLARYLPRTEGANLVLLSRHGVPLVLGGGGDAVSVRDFFDRVSELLWLLDPDNPAGWADRLHYLKATRPGEFAHGRTGPVLVGNPLRAESLRKYGVKRIAARLEVAADGKVTPALLSGEDDMPAALGPAITAALTRVVAAPALEEGRPVAGQLDFLLEVPAADAQREADRIWLSSTKYPVLPIPEWLVLRPIPVPEKEFESSVVGETASGTLILSPLEVSASKVSRVAQLNAFNSDWFAATGADSVRPKEGDRQTVDGKTLTWEKVRSVEGFVDMQTGLERDYTVGYAWAEFESPADTDAWLGLGSDDGVKIWLNGTLVLDKWIRRPSRVDEDVVPLRLRKGPNRMLVKIQNITGEWSFIYRLRLRPR